MAKTLLEQALAESKNRELKHYPLQELELAVAWVSGKIETKQVSAVIKLSPGNTTAWLAARIRKAVSVGLIEVKVKHVE